MREACLTIREAVHAPAATQSAPLTPTHGCDECKASMCNERKKEKMADTGEEGTGKT